MYGENLLNGGDTLAKKGSMTSEASSRIQSNADKTGTNQGFKSRAMSAASKNQK
jgi:hypothetical protein